MPAATATFTVTGAEGTVTPQEEARAKPTVTPLLPTSTPASELSEPSLWIEYRDAYGYGVALPCFWQIVAPPKEAVGGAPVVASYDELFAMAHSVRGHWVDGVWHSHGS